jgi:YfiH family protein
VSEGPFAQLNLARNVGDAPQAVAENHLRFAHEVGFETGQLYELSQVHGAQVVRVELGDMPGDVRQLQGDALVTTEPTFALGVRVADCVPLLLADPHSGAVAAVHAGWRGVVSRVIEAAVESLCEASGAAPARLLCAFGPHIGPDAFEVGADVAAQIAAAANAQDVIVAREPVPHVDLARAAIHQLVRAGLANVNIDHVQGCTVGEAGRFFSFRRDGARSGRHLAAIVAGC